MNSPKTKNAFSKAMTASTLAVLLGALTLLTTAGDPPGSPTLSDHLFAQRIAGSYLADFQDGSRLLLKLDLGGGTHRETGDDFIGLTGLPDLPFHFYGGGFGNWTRTGPRTIRIVELAFQFGNNGLVTAIPKVHIEVEFSPDLQSARGTAVVGVYLPDQDPLSEEPAFPGPTFEGIVFRSIQ